MAWQSIEGQHGGSGRGWSSMCVVVLVLCCCALLGAAEESMRQWCPRYHGVNAQPGDVCVLFPMRHFLPLPAVFCLYRKTRLSERESDHCSLTLSVHTLSLTLSRSHGCVHCFAWY